MPEVMVEQKPRRIKLVLIMDDEEFYDFKEALDFSGGDIAYDILEKIESQVLDE